MRVPRIFTNQTIQIANTLQLEENASRHIAKVLRLNLHDELVLFNGEGGEFRATIANIEKKFVSVTPLEFNHTNRQSPLKIELAIAVSKGDRMDWIIQKATELGVHRITPLFTERTEVKLSGTRLDKKVQHWRNISISACEQCQRNNLVDINLPQPYASWVSTSIGEKKFVLHHRASQESLNNEASPSSILLLIGPEGGLSPGEITLAQENEFSALALGPRVLRTETAPVTAISIFQYLWGDISPI